MSVGKKNLVWNFLSVGEKNVGWKKHFVGWKKNVRWKISPAIPGNVRTFPGMRDRKTAEAETKPLGPRAALGTERNSGPKTERHNFRKETKKGETVPPQLSPNTQSW